jgi:phenolic acid decarboxylase
VDFLFKHCTKTFMDHDYRVQRKSLLTEVEMARMPETQSWLNEWEQAEKTLKDTPRGPKLDREMRYLIGAIQQCSSEQAEYLQDFIGQQQRIQNHPEYQGYVASHPVVTRYRLMYHQRDENVQVKNKDRRAFAMPCPVADCRGFLSTQYKCGMCNHQLCPRCHDPKHDEECDADKLATIALIKQQSKPCPKCGARISKVDGCDQMWCIGCHTAFSWNTGTIHNGNIHNPEYYRWVREHPEQKVDMQGCQRIDWMLVVNQADAWWRKRRTRDDPRNHYEVHASFWASALRCLDDARASMQHKRRKGNFDLRIDYLRGDIDRPAMEREILTRDRVTIRNQYLSDMIELMAGVIQEILQRWIKSQGENLDAYRTEALNLFHYYNEQALTFGKQMNLKMPPIPIEGGVIRNMNIRNLRS